MVPKPERAASRFRSPPKTPAPPEALLPGAEGMAKGRRRLSRAASAEAGGAQHVRARPRKAPGCARRRGRRAGSRNFPTCLFPLPATLSSSRDPVPPLCTAASGPARGAGGPRRRPGGGVTCRESFQPSARFPTPRAGPRGAVGSALGGGLSSGFRGYRCSRSCHCEGCDPARPPASHGPPRGLIGSPSPRPRACSRRHLPLARPPAAPPAPRPARRCGGSRDPPGRGARTFRRTRAQRSPPHRSRSSPQLSPGGWGLVPRG